jgi:Tfp pilus assembly protein PilV
VKRARTKRGESGFAVIEAAASSFVLAIGLVGLVVSVGYGRQLERRTQDTWRAASAATATLEQIRAESRSDWSRIPTAWNDSACSTGTVENVAGEKLVAAVDATADSLADATGMWSTGATQPNFYFVRVAPSADAGDLSRSLVFQTYVANRGDGAWSSTTPDSGDYSASITASAATATTSAGKLSTVGASVGVSGTGGTTATVTLQNTSSVNSGLATFKVTAPSTVKVSYVAVNGNVIFQNASKAASAISVSNCAALMPNGIVPGPVTIEIRSTATTLADKTVAYAFTFSDKSTKTVTVTP